MLLFSITISTRDLFHKDKIKEHVRQNPITQSTVFIKNSALHTQLNLVWKILTANTHWTKLQARFQVLAPTQKHTEAMLPWLLYVQVLPIQSVCRIISVSWSSMKCQIILPINVLIIRFIMVIQHRWHLVRALRWRHAMLIRDVVLTTSKLLLASPTNAPI
jgi:hypothetical protein